MKLARMDWHGRAVWARIDGDTAYESTGPGEEIRDLSTLGPVSEGRFLAPILPHNKVIILLGNFDGKQERRGPGFCLKPTSAAIGHLEPIDWTADAPEPNFEAELAVVVGKRASHVTVEEAGDYILGYTISNDMSSFPVLEEDGWSSISSRFKLCDNALPLGPWIETEAEPEKMKMRAVLNGEVKQSVDLKDMAFTAEETLAWITSTLTLEPGDVISMATPPGFVPMVSGDVIRCEIDGIGVLENRMV